MGRIITPAYRVEYRDNLLAMGKTRADGRSRIDGRPVLMMAWSGRPTAKRLEDWRQGYNASFGPNRTNAHITRAFNIIPHIHFCRIVRQRDNTVIAEITAPTFEVV